MGNENNNASRQHPPRMAEVKPKDNKEQLRSIEEQKKHGQFPLHDEEIGGG